MVLRAKMNRTNSSKENQLVQASNSVSKLDQIDYSKINAFFL